MKTRILIPILLVLLLAGCTADRPSAGTEWLLDSMVVNGDTIDLSSNNPITLKISDSNQVGGSSGCNTYFGEIEFKSGGGLTAEAFGATEMACENGMDTEAAFLGALSRVDSYTYSEFELVLTGDGSQTVLTFLLLQTAE